VLSQDLAEAGNAAAYTAPVAAPEQTLEALVRDELRGPVSELVRRLVPELVAEQLKGLYLPDGRECQWKSDPAFS
jgi:hypothetical protein